MLTVKNKKFFLDGKEFKIQSGSFHYFRALPQYWEDILTKIKAAGLNCVETYTCWNLHEPRRGEYDFSGMLDLEKFIQTADKVGLKVILRTGPYICAEWENGGLPSWLLKREYNVRLRCKTEPYMTFLKEWFHVLLGKIRPYLDVNGGPVIAMAVENEYGSFGDDFEYLKAVEQIYRDEGMDCLYIAADGNKKYHLSTGKSGNHIIHGMDFGGVGTKASLDIIDEYDPDAPYMALEYWAGNFTNWGFDECTHVDDEVVRKTMNNFVDLGASFNIYMVFGGTNFGFYNGGQGDLSWMRDVYNPTVTSYDYDAAITEWGGYTQRYMDIKDAMERDHSPSDTPMPKSPSLQSIGTVKLTQSAPLFENLHMGRHYKSVTVESMEEFDQNFGYILYSKTMTYDAELNIIKLLGIRDRAHVYVNKKLVGIRFRGMDESVIELEQDLKTGDTIDILVENMGRICYGEDTYFGDPKGLTGAVELTFRKNGDVRIPGKVAFNWDVTCLDMDNPEQIQFVEGTDTKAPAFFRGTFKTDCRDSCFVRFDNLKKGFIWINGFNIGRYWERGPLEALYIPGALLKEDNEIIVFETDGFRGEPAVEITNVSGIPNHHPEIIV